MKIFVPFLNPVDAFGVVSIIVEESDTFAQLKRRLLSQIGQGGKDSALRDCCVCLVFRSAFTMKPPVYPPVSANVFQFLAHEEVRSFNGTIYLSLAKTGHAPASCVALLDKNTSNMARHVIPHSFSHTERDGTSIRKTASEPLGRLIESDAQRQDDELAVGSVPVMTKLFSRIIHICKIKGMLMRGINLHSFSANMDWLKQYLVLTDSRLWFYTNPDPTSRVIPGDLSFIDLPSKVSVRLETPKVMSMSQSTLLWVDIHGTGNEEICLKTRNKFEAEAWAAAFRAESAPSYGHMNENKVFLECEEEISVRQSKTSSDELHSILGRMNTFEGMMKSNPLRKGFRKYLNNSYMSESFLFWERAEDYRQGGMSYTNELSIAEAQSWAQLIFDSFLADGASQQISDYPGDGCKKIEQLIKSARENGTRPPSTLFVEAQAASYRKLKHGEDQYLAFSESQSYRKLLQSSIHAHHRGIHGYFPIQGDICSDINMSWRKESPIETELPDWWWATVDFQEHTQGEEEPMGESISRSQPTMAGAQIDRLQNIDVHFEGMSGAELDPISTPTALDVIAGKVVHVGTLRLQYKVMSAEKISGINQEPVDLLAFVVVVDHNEYSALLLFDAFVDELLFKIRLENISEIAIALTCFNGFTLKEILANDICREWTLVPINQSVSTSSCWLHVLAPRAPPSCSVVTILREGPLQKRGYHNRAYQNRWFVLTSTGLLVYFKLGYSLPSNTGVTGEYKGCIEINRRCKLVTESESRFDIVTPHRTFSFLVSTTDAHDWTSSIMTLIK